MSNIAFYNTNEVPDELLKFAVIAARYKNQWIFCRHKARNTWEIPGGHRESNEDIADTARRELYEETGALEADIKPVCIYRASDYGMLFYADVKMMGELPPKMEIGEIKLFDALPQELTYPSIQPQLYLQIQAWLNMQANADELWDVYDENRNLTGRTHRRGDPLPAGDYHLVVDIWLQNSKGEFLLTKRAPNKGFPGMWECSGGSALAGDDSLTAAIREVREETGLTIRPENGHYVLSVKLQDRFRDVWLFSIDASLADVVLQPRETCDAMYANKAQILTMQKEGTLVPISYLEDFLRKSEELSYENGNIQ